MAIKSKDVKLSVPNKAEPIRDNSGKDVEGELGQGRGVKSRLPHRAHIDRASTGRKVAEIDLTLPVSKRTIKLVKRDIKASETWVSPLNPRNQALLSESDPEIQAFRKRIKEETQRDPVLARLNSGPNGEPFEIIYGSRRRFVALLEEEINPEFLLVANIGEIGDADAARLARSENEDRASLSAYELGCDYQKQLSTVFKDVDQKVFAEYLGKTETHVSRHLGLTKIPVELIGLLISPSRLSSNSGPKFLKVIEALSPKEIASFVQSREGLPKFAKDSELIKALQSVVASNEQQKVFLKKPLLFGTPKEGTVGARLVSKRGKPNEYKVDLSGVGDDEVKEVVDFLEKLCRPKR